MQISIRVQYVEHYYYLPEVYVVLTKGDERSAGNGYRIDLIDQFFYYSPPASCIYNEHLVWYFPDNCLNQ